jgi:SNF2 family DNA or RNA helicase
MMIMNVSMEKRDAVDMKHICEYSLFLKVPDSKYYKDKVQELPRKWKNLSSGEIEVPLLDITKVLRTFEQIEIIGDIPELKLMKMKRDMTKREYYTNLECVEEYPIEMPFKGDIQLKPYGHQIEAFHYMMNRNSFLLGDDMGLGKTLEFISGCEWRRKKYGDGFSKVLYVTKAGLKYNVRDEIKFWLPNAKVITIEGDSKKRLEQLRNVYTCKELVYFIMGYEQVKNHIQQLELIPIDGIAIDESHKMKNPSGAVWGALSQLRDIPFKVVMSGTYIINNHEEAWTPLTFIGVESREFHHFKWSYYESVKGRFGREITGTRKLDELGKIVRSNMLRRTKSEVMDMPEKNYKNVYVEMGGKQTQIYKAVRDRIKQELSELGIGRGLSNPMVKLLRLKQVTTNPELIGSDAPSVKHEELIDIISDIVKNGEKAIVFSQFEEETQRLKLLLAEYNPAYVTGVVAPQDRKKQADKFQDDDSCKVFIGTSQSCREGLNLTVATYVIFMDLEWAPAYIAQAEDRAYRIGQKNNVTIIRLLCRGSIDEYIVNEVLSRKQQIFDEIITGKRAITPNEIKDILDAI